jgi:hypothetical protein
MYINSNFYRNYATRYMYESAATLSEDPQKRIAEYLDNDDLLKELIPILTTAENGKTITLTIDKEKYGINSEDNIILKVDKINPDSPKFIMWLENEKILFGSVDFSVASNIIKDAIEGMGTDEEMVAAVAGAFIKIANENAIDPIRYFEKLSSSYSSVSGGESLTTAIEGDFSGRAEVTALGAFQLPIESSVMRGITDNWGQILVDVTLAAVTFGGSYAAQLSAKGAVAGANLAAKGANIAAKGGKVAQGAGKVVQGAGKALELISQGLGSFYKMSTASKGVAVEKALAQNGGKWVAKSGKQYAVQSFDKATGTFKLGEVGGTNVLTYGADEMMRLSGAPFQANALNAAGITAISAAELANRTDAAGDVSDLTFQGNAAEDTLEFLGYYDAMAADPNKFVNSVKQMSVPKDIAQQLKNYKDGSGLFGNTTDQEELAISLMLMYMNPIMANEVNAQFTKLAGMDLYAMVDDELEDVMGYFVKAYLHATLGLGQDSIAQKVDQVYARIKTA